jgi:hypothetical protein
MAFHAKKRFLQEEGSVILLRSHFSNIVFEDSRVFEKLYQYWDQLNKNDLVVSL